MIKIRYNKVDIKENDLLNYDEELLCILLKDHSSNKNIIWATDNYQPLGSKYNSNEQITIDLITGINGKLIKPRVNKNKVEKTLRVREKAEVFTPSWICNKQINIIDKEWFGESRVFNTETNKGWTTKEGKIQFPSKTGKGWQDYVSDVRLEICCGEGPYIVSRYDTISGKSIPIEHRIGVLDRKLRVVSENTNNSEEWIEWAKIAYQSTYAYEWQGDNLLLTRENLLFSYLDYYRKKFHKTPRKDIIFSIAEIISWNVWQMDGVKATVPNSCNTDKFEENTLFEPIVQYKQCEGCLKNNVKKHIGI
jgi:hypothetical protein